VKKGNVGTKHFRAPETYPEIPEGEIPEGQQFSYDPTKADIYSLACTVMIMLTGL
jgi:serine/threonine protein kinase